MSKITTRYLVLYVIFLLAACSRGEPGEIINGKVSVSVEKVQIEQKKLNLSYPATLEPAAKIVYRFPMDVKIERVAVRLGEKVTPGDILFELNAMDLSLKLGGLKAKRQEKKSLWDKNAYFVENRDRLLQEGKIDQTQYDSLPLEVNSSKAEYERLNTEVEQIENQIQNTTVRATLDAIVSEMNLAPGAMITAGETLLTVVQIDPIYCAFQVPILEAAGITKEMNVNVTLEGFEDKTLLASILAISPETDPATRTLGIKATLPNPGFTLRGGMRAQVRFLSLRPTRILSISSQALLQEGDKEYVYVVRANKAWPVRVYTKKETESPDRIEIEGGLSEEDLVVTEGQVKLKAGSEVNLWR